MTVDLVTEGCIDYPLGLAWCATGVGFALESLKPNHVLCIFNKFVVDNRQEGGKNFLAKFTHFTIQSTLYKC